MINANELRIGNLVKNYKGVETTATISTINEAHKFKGIKITEELLNRFGAYHVNQISEFWEGDHVYIYELMIDGIDCLFSKNGKCQQYNHIKYVHQLQNLYFAETGKELTIK